MVEFCLREKIQAEEMHGWRIGVPLDDSNHPDPVLIPADSKQKLNEKAFDVYTVDSDMSEAVQVMLEYVARTMAELTDPELYLESAYDLSWVYPGMFGTSDVTISEEFGTLVVADYKHGQGVPVHITGTDGKPNSQIMYYAAGAAHDAGWTHEKARLAIVQPRCYDVPDVQEIEISIAELRKWAENDLRKAAELTDDDNPILVAGDHCKWCTVQAICVEARAKAFAIAKADFDGVVDELPVPQEAHELSRALGWLPMIDNWVKAVNAEVQRRLEAGLEVPSYKLVRKRSVRKIDPELTEEEVRKRVIAAARGEAKAADLFEQKLRPLGQLEKASKKLKAALAEGQGITVKPEGGLTVAHVSDKRPAVSLLGAAANAFAGVEDD
jgi:hypothetical protein